MTTIVLNWIARLDRNQPGELSQEGIVAMKGLLLGMLVCMAAGAESLIFIPEGPLTLQQQFIFGLIAGSVGTVVGASLFEIETLKKLARHASSNLGLAALFGPLCVWALRTVCGIESTFVIVLPIFGSLGIGGSLIFGKVWPAILDMAANRARAEAQKLLGGNDVEPS